MEIPIMLKDGTDTEITAKLDRDIPCKNCEIMTMPFYFRRYNCQKALDTLLHGRPQQTKHIPFMVINDKCSLF